MKARILFVFGLAVCGCVSFEAGAPPGRVDVIAHRGASAYAPENTLAAFRKAIDLGADWFELDCTLSKDGEVVVIHDDTLARTTGGVPGAVRDYTLQQLKEFEVGKWFSTEFAGEPIPTLGESLDLAKNRIGVYIEIKNSDDDTELTRSLLADYSGARSLLPKRGEELLSRIEQSGTLNLELTRKVIAQVRDLGMERQIIIQSFSAIVCAVALVEAPELRTELLATSSERDPEQWTRCLTWNRLLGPHGFNANKKDLTESLVREQHARGRSIAVWTVNDTPEMHEFVHMGVDALITDRPDIALGALGVSRM